MRFFFFIIAFTFVERCSACDVREDSVGVDSLQPRLEKLHVADQGVASADSVPADSTRIKLFASAPYYLLDEVTIFGRRRDRTTVDFHVDPIDYQLMQSQPMGFNPLGLAELLVKKIVGPRHKMTRHERWKKAIDNY